MDQLKPVLEYIDANYASPVTLADLSRIAGMTPKYFCRYFRTAVHRTPMDYLNYYRVERACYILSTTELPVTEIAYQCGFNDSSYFVKTFNEIYGSDPEALCPGTSLKKDRISKTESFIAFPVIQALSGPFG